MMKQLLNHNPSSTINMRTTDDLALLNSNSETHRQVDANLHAFDDLHMINRQTIRNEIRVEPLERITFEKRQNSIFKRQISDKVEFEDKREHKRFRGTTQYKTSDFLSPSIFEAKFDEFGKKTELGGNQYRSTSFSGVSGSRKKKAQELTRLYEYEPEDDQDPYFEIYDCRKMTFLESYLNKPLNNYTKLDMRQFDNYSADKQVHFKKEEVKESKSRLSKRKNLEVEKALRPVYIDEEEKKLYTEYFDNGAGLINKRAEFEKLKKKPDADVNQLASAFYSFIQPTYREKDYKKIEEPQRYDKTMLKSMKFNLVAASQHLA
jgi:hypothetical protein